MRRRVVGLSTSSLSRTSTSGSSSSIFSSSSSSILSSSSLSSSSSVFKSTSICSSSILFNQCQYQQQRNFFRLVDQYERGVTLTLGKLSSVKQPGFRIVIPFFQEMKIVDIRTQVSELNSQEIITRDNVAANVSAVCYYRVVHPELSLLEVTNYKQAIEQLIQTEIRDALCQQMFSDILNQRNKLSEDIKENVHEIAKKWGVDIERVQMKKIDLVDPAMVRAMAKEAEASRERIAAIIRADGELDAAKKLVMAAELIGNGTALELRRLQTLEKLGKERGQHTVVIPVNLGMSGGVESAVHGAASRSSSSSLSGGGVDAIATQTGLSAAFGGIGAPAAQEESFNRSSGSERSATIDKGVDEFNSLLSKMH